MRVSNVSCCKDCKDRYVGCHGLCKTYINESAERKKSMKEFRKKKRIDNILDGISADNSLKSIKYKNLKH
jgi:hypothetical protein